MTKNEMNHWTQKNRYSSCCIVQMTFNFYNCGAELTTISLMFWFMKGLHQFTAEEEEYPEVTWPSVLLSVSFVILKSLPRNLNKQSVSQLMIVFLRVSKVKMQMNCFVMALKGTCLF